MRKQLELLHECGAKLPEETNELVEHHLEAKEDASTVNETDTSDTTTIKQGSETPYEESVQVHFRI